MSEVFFVIKTVVITALFIALIQVRVGGETLEAKLDDFVRASSFGARITEVAQGLVELSGRAFRKSQRWIQGQSVSDKEAKDTLAPGRRDPIPNLMKRNRSQDSEEVSK